MEIISIRTQVLDENTYLIHNNKECLLIDPGSDSPLDLEKFKKAIGEMKLLAILCTHNHFDHIGGIYTFKVPVYMHSEDINTLKKQVDLAELFINKKLILPKNIIPLSDNLSIGPFSCKVIHTPGHTKGGVCFLFNKHLFTGDTLFKSTFGRTDLIGGSHQEIVASLHKLSLLDEEIMIYPGHGGFSTIKAEKAWITNMSF